MQCLRTCALAQSELVAIVAEYQQPSIRRKRQIDSQSKLKRRQVDKLAANPNPGCKDLKHLLQMASPTIIASVDVLLPA